MADSTGALCVLCSEAPSGDPPASWQLDLEHRFGGKYRSPVHVTLQTVVPGEKPITADLVRTLKETVWNLPATSVQGSRLEAIYSGFYGYWIAKLRVPATSELRQARLAIQSVVERNGLRGLIPAPEDGGLIYLTVVDSLDPPDSRWDLSVSPPAADLAKPIMISLNALRITRVISSSEYELLESWKLC